MSLFFDLPTSLQLEICSSWLCFPRRHKNLVNFDEAVSNKALRVSLKELYEALTWDENFSCNFYYHVLVPMIRWLIAREIRLIQLNLARFQIESEVFNDFMVANGKTLKVIKLSETKSAMAVVMKYIARHCTVLKTLWLEGCNVTQLLALVLKKCTTLKELRLRSAHFKKPDAQDLAKFANLRTGLFAKVFCPSVTKLAILHPLSSSEMAAVVAAFPNVVELELTGYKFSQPVPIALNAWRKLEAVDLRYKCNGGDLITEEVCAALAESASTLRSLTFACSPNNFALDAFKTLLTKCEKLVDVRFETTVSHDLVSVIAECCGQRLLLLHTPDSWPFTTAAVHALVEKCPNLRTLSAPSLFDCVDYPLILEKCVHLENLHVSFGRNANKEREIRALLHNIIAHCRNLRQLSLQYFSYWWSIEAELAALLDNNKKLRVIGLDPYSLRTFSPAVLSKAKFVSSLSHRKSIAVQSYDQYDTY